MRPRILLCSDDAAAERFYSEPVRREQTFAEWVTECDALWRTYRNERTLAEADETIIYEGRSKDAKSLSNETVSRSMNKPKLGGKAKMLPERHSSKKVSIWHVYAYKRSPYDANH